MERRFPTRIAEILDRQTDEAWGDVARACAVIRRESLARFHHSAGVLDGLLPQPRGREYYVDLFLRGVAHGRHGDTTAAVQICCVQPTSAHLPILDIEGLGALYGCTLAMEDLCRPSAASGDACASTVHPGQLTRYLAERAASAPPRDDVLGRRRFLDRVERAIEEIRVALDARVEAIARDRDLVRSPRLIDDLAESFGEGGRAGYTQGRPFTRLSRDDAWTTDAFLRLMGALAGTCAVMAIVAGVDVPGLPTGAVTPGHVARATRAAARAALARGWGGDIEHIKGGVRRSDLPSIDLPHTALARTRANVARVTPLLATA